MNPLSVSMATFAVSAIFIVWENYRRFVERRERVLRSRVAFMLWCAAARDEG
jgi:hypothetical protein